jgi:hypothetical protein
MLRRFVRSSFYFDWAMKFPVGWVALCLMVVSDYELDSLFNECNVVKSGDKEYFIGNVRTPKSTM